MDVRDLKQGRGVYCCAPWISSLRPVLLAATLLLSISAALRAAEPGAAPSTPLLVDETSDLDRSMAVDDAAYEEAPVEFRDDYPADPMDLGPDLDSVEEEPELAPEAVADPTFAAGDGYLGFYDFGAVPGYANQVGVLGSPLAWQPSFRGATLKRIGKFRLGGSITASAAYTDNVFGTRDGREGDIVFGVTPTIFIETGNRGNIRLLYSPTFQQYARYSSESRIDQTLLLTFNYPFTKLEIGGGLLYTTRSGVFATTDDFAELDTYAGNFYARYRVSDKTTVGLEYNFTLQSGDPGTTIFDNSVIASLDYQLSPRISVGAYVQPGVIFTDANDQHYLTAGVRGRYLVSSRLEVFGRVGMQARGYDGDSIGDGLLTPVLLAGVAWTPMPVLSLNAQVYRDVTNNPFESGQATIRTGGTISGSLLMWRKLTLNCFASLAYFEQISNTGGTNEEYLYGSAGTSLSYPITRNLSGSIFYNYSARDPLSNTASFNRNVLGVALTWTF